MQRKSPP